MNKWTEKVLTAIEWSNLAGLPAKDIKNQYKDAMVFDETSTNTQFYMLQISKVLIISFRGSQQLPDWIRDFEAWQVVYPYDNKESKIQVHKGFIEAYKSVRSKILDYITKNRSQLVRVFVTGHSLGGALATLCAVDIQYNNPTLVVEGFPLGNPKVGNQAFVDSFNKRCPNVIRTYMRKDLVPELPPARFGKYGYAHAGVPNPIGPANILIGIINWFKNMFNIGTDTAALILNHSTKLYKEYA